MEKSIIHYDWTVMAPELILVAAAALMTLIDLVMKERWDRRWLGALGLAAVLAAGAFVVTGFGGKPYEILGNTYRVDDFALTFKALILGGTALVLLLSFAHLGREEVQDQGEYYYLLLSAALGGMIMASSADLITLFVGLELLSISSYILVGVRKKRTDSGEAAWKYVILGGASSAFILYGMSFLYGMAGSTNLFVVQQRLVEAYTQGYESFVYLSLFLMIVGFGFKVASAPFHTWAYQGAPTPVTGFLAVVSKTAAFAFVFRILIVAYLQPFQMGMWLEIAGPLLLILAGASMIVGNAVALRQTNAKRLLAYSSIAHAGYLLVPLAVWGFSFFESTLYYLLAYLLMTIGAFAVLMIVEKNEKSEDIAAFAGLYQRSPLLAVAMTILLVSLAGIPVTAGFFGKFYILVNALSSAKLWIALIM
ncbi:MAG: NADH-quinone oxidoreductase subunit N, partial [Planifilum fimeticola]